MAATTKDPKDLKAEVLAHVAQMLGDQPTLSLEEALGQLDNVFQRFVLPMLMLRGVGRAIQDARQSLVPLGQERTRLMAERDQLALGNAKLEETRDQGLAKIDAEHAARMAEKQREYAGLETRTADLEGRAAEARAVIAQGQEWQRKMEEADAIRRRGR